MILEELARVSAPILQKGSLEYKYFNLLRKGGSKESALKLLKGSANPDRYLRVLQSQLKKKMVANIASKPRKSGSSNVDNKNQANQLYVAGRYLVDIQCYKSGINLLQSAHALALKTEQLNIALESARYLEYYFVTLSGDLKRAEKYSNDIPPLLKRYTDELTAQRYYQEVSYHFAHKWNKDVATKARTYAVIIRDTIDSSLETAAYYYSMLCIACISDYSWIELKETCQYALNFMEARNAKASGLIKEFSFKKATAHIKLKEYKLALSILDKISDISESGTYSYCTALFYKAVVGLHSGDIKLSIQQIVEAKQYYKKLPDSFVEQWKIIQAYVALFDSRQFRINKFLNEVPIFEKDKAGANAAILIVQMLHILKKGGIKNQDAYSKRCDALQEYSRRYLKGRMKTFAKMLVEVQRGHFNKLNIEYRTKKHLKDLEAQSMEIEVMPLERVWGLVMGWIE